jgi:hypothetical protein
MISASQCRCARTLLRWSVSKLLSAPSVSESAIDDFELERRQPSAITTHAIRRAFEDAGVVFLPQAWNGCAARQKRSGRSHRNRQRSITQSAAWNGLVRTASTSRTLNKCHLPASAGSPRFQFLRIRATTRSRALPRAALSVTDITRYENIFQRPGSIQSSWCARPAEAPAHWRLSLRYFGRHVRYAPARRNVTSPCDAAALHGSPPAPKRRRASPRSEALRRSQTRLIR